MRLFTRDQKSYILEIDNGFEGMTLGEANEDPDDDWLIGGSGTHEWGDFTTGPFFGARNGTKAVYRFGGINNTNLYQTFTESKNILIEGWVLWETDNDDDLIPAAIQVDNGVRTDDIILLNQDQPSTALTVLFTFHDVENNGEPTLNIDLIARYENVPATYQTLGSIPAVSHAPNTNYVGVRVEFTETGWILFADYTDSGDWIIINQGPHTSLSGVLNESLDKFRIFNGGTGADIVAFDDMKLWQISIIEGTEITNLKDIKTVVAEDMGGSCQVIVSDHNMTSFASLSQLKRFEGDVKNKDLSKTRGEFLFARQSFSRHTVTFLGIERGRILEKINAEYNSVLAEGEVTAISDPVITDIEASFDDSLLGKFLTFTDVLGPSIETIYPNSDSTYGKTAGDDADYIFDDDWEGLGDPASDGFGFIDLSAPVNLQDYVEINWTVPNQASSTIVNIEIKVRFHRHKYFQVSGDDGRPLFSIYNFNTPDWESGDLANHEGIGRIEAWADESAEVTHTIKIVDNITDYFDGSNKCKIRIYYGTSEETLPIAGSFQVIVWFAELKNTYSLIFNAYNQIYEIDARTPTTLTVTGQTPNGDGVAINDRYKVGDNLRNVLIAIFNSSLVATFLTLNCMSTTKVDATDWSSSNILPILRLYAKRMGARIWQSIPYIINIQDTFVSTGITLYEEDEVTDHEGKGFEWIPDGSNIISKVKVSGAGVFAKGEQIPAYISYQTKTITDNRISTQEAANDMVTKELEENIDAKNTLKFTIDYDFTKTRTWNSSKNFNTIAHFKTINVDFSIGGVQKLDISAGIITKMIHFSAIDGHERITLFIEDVN